MLTPRGFSDHSAAEAASQVTPRTRTELLASRSAARDESAQMWVARHDALVEKQRNRTKDLCSSSNFVQEVVKHMQQYAAYSSGTGPRPSTDDVPDSSGVGNRGVAPDSRHFVGYECETHFTPFQSKRIDRSNKSKKTAVDELIRHDEGTSVELTQGGPRRPVLPKKRREAYQMPSKPTERDYTLKMADGSTLSCVGHIPLHQTYTKNQPQITPLEDPNMPIYSSVSGDKAFHPEFDQAMKPFRERQRRAREEALARIRMRRLHHRAVAREAEATFAKVEKLKVEAMKANNFVSIETEESSRQHQLKSVEVEKTSGIHHQHQQEKPHHVLLNAADATTTVVAFQRPYNPHRALTSPRCEMPSKPPDAAIIQAMVDESLRSKHEPSEQATERRSTIDEHPTADTISEGESAKRKRPLTGRSRPLHQAYRPGLQFLVRPASAKTRPIPDPPQHVHLDEHRESRPPTSLDLFAMTRVPSVLASNRSAFVPTPPPASDLPRNVGAAVKPTRPQSAIVRGGKSKSSADPWGVVDNFQSTGAVVVEARRPQSARVPGHIRF